MISSPSEIGAEVRNSVLWLKLAVEAIGALVIGVGMSLAAWRFVAGLPPAVVTFANVRLTLARWQLHSNFNLAQTFFPRPAHPLGTPSASLPQLRSSERRSTIFSAVTCKKLAHRHAKLRSDVVV